MTLVAFVNITSREWKFYCREFKATGGDANGGYGEFMTVPEKVAFIIPANFTDAEAVPLLCAGVSQASLALVDLKNKRVKGGGY